MKTCSSCLEEKPLSAFHKRSAAKDGLQARCKDCNCKQRMAYYRTAKGKESNALSGQRHQKRLFLKVLTLLEGGCVDCGESDPVVLDFDHRNPDTKLFTICDGVSYGYAWSRIQAEASKCDVRCANCHRRRTAKQFGWRKLIHGPVAQR